MKMNGLMLQVELFVEKKFISYLHNKPSEMHNFCLVFVCLGVSLYFNIFHSSGDDSKWMEI